VTLITIGRFSKMTRLSVKALRLYAENGLLPPANIDSKSGYRYYRADQAGQAEIIRVLRSVDMPLPEIRLFLDTKDSEPAHQQLLIHKERLTEGIALQQRMLAHLDSIIQNQGGVSRYEVLIEEAAPRQIAAVKIYTSLSQIAKDIQGGFATLMQGLARAGVSPMGPPMILHHDLIDERTDGNIEICVPVERLESSESEVYERELEGGTVASTLHHGPYEQIGPAYHVLTGWIFDNAYEIAGPPREIYLNDPQTVAPEALLTRLEFPVCPDRAGE